MHANAHSSCGRETVAAFADSDLLLLLFAAVSYFDAERDIYIVSGGHADTTKALKAAEKDYSKLERECRAGPLARPRRSVRQGGTANPGCPIQL